jgi:hemolysin III
MIDREQSLGEEIANSISHGAGLALAILGAPFLIISSIKHGDSISVAAATIFIVSAMLLYGASMMYHALINQRAKQLFMLLDHGAIYLLIAGTYTPFTLGVLRDSWGWPLFWTIWLLAGAGVFFKVTKRLEHPYLSTGLYVVMGWLIVVAIKPLMLAVPAAGLWWLLAGGLAYTLGVVFFLQDAKWRYGHFVWHLFVLAGTACHFVAVYGYAI